MKRDRKLQLLQGVVCLLGAAVTWRYRSFLEGTEFSGGWVTGALLDMKEVGSLLFVLALLLTFFYRRMAAAVTLISSLLCLPLYLYFTAPGPFRRLFGKAEWSVPLRANFVWDHWTIVGIVTLAIAAYISLRSLSFGRDPKS
jgi:hypothetical protein